jgi:L-threonylcarbamoyladenylate synthase
MKKFDNDITNCLAAINNSGIILYPTDTIWGIGCDATNAAAIQRIYQLKKREEKKSMIILVDNENMIEQYVSCPSEKILSFLSQQEKPTTAIFDKAINLPEIIINQDRTIAIRITTDEFCRSLIQQLKKPLISTSANISGEPYPQSFSEVSEHIKKGVDYIVEHRQDDRSPSKPSSIIRLNENNKIEFIR